MKNRNELYRVVPIFDSELTDDEIRSFSVKHKEGQGLITYLSGQAEVDEENKVMRTYIIRDTDTNEVAGYFSLKAGMISINERRDRKRESFDTLPGIELANYAVNYKYVEKHKEAKGIGYIFFELFVVPIALEVSHRVGVRIIYIFSLPFIPLMKRYEDYGFKRLSSHQEDELHRRLKPNYDRGCIFMYQELQGKQIEREEIVE